MVGSKATHYVKVKVRMPVTMVFRFGIDEKRDTISSMKTEAKIVAGSKAQELLGSMVNDDARLSSFVFGDGDVLDIDIILPDE